MSSLGLVPAAQYLRMSTQQQQYSLKSQAEANRSYAQSHGLEIVRTYLDIGKSGVLLRHRPALIRLLNDIVGGGAPFGAVLVYDVSRWGRFQDSDEAAHYEFLCKSAGVRVHYCAESFTNGSTLHNSIAKAVKRTMAAEYSREMGEKCFAGCKRLAELGFKQGGTPGYGLRRLMLSADGQHKQILATGELKSLKTDRVILIQGPEEEVRWVREMYRLVTQANKTPYRVAAELNREGVYCPEGKWRVARVNRILTDPKYAGYNVWNRTTRRLGQPTVQLPKAKWLLRPKAFEAIVEPEVFEKTQQVLADQRRPYSNEELLESLRDALARNGTLSYRLMKEASLIASATTFIKRFGSLRRAFELAGHRYPWTLAGCNRDRANQMQDALVNRIQSMFPGEILTLQSDPAAPPCLQLDGQLIVSVMVCPAIRRKGQVNWVADRRYSQEKTLTLLARLTVDNTTFRDFHILPAPPRHWIRHRGELKGGTQLSSLSEFCSVVRAISSKVENGFINPIGPGLSWPRLHANYFFVGMSRPKETRCKRTV